MSAGAALMWAWASAGDSSPSERSSVSHSRAYQGAAAAHSFSIKICVFLACTPLRQCTNNATGRAANRSTCRCSYKPSGGNHRADTGYREQPKSSE